MDDFQLYGYSLFETILAKQGYFWRLAAHWRRLALGARHFGLREPSWAEFRREIDRAHDSRKAEVLRVALVKIGGRWSSASPETGWQILKQSHGGAPPRSVRLKLADQALPVTDPFRNFKSGSRMVYQWHHDRARAANWDDCLFTDLDGYLLETATHNLYARLDGNWFTPPACLGLLPGVAREWALSRNWVQERPLRREDFPAIEALAVSNAVWGFLPVVAVNDFHFPPAPASAWIQQMGEREFQPMTGEGL